MLVLVVACESADSKRAPGLHVSLELDASEALAVGSAAALSSPLILTTRIRSTCCYPGLFVMPDCHSRQRSAVAVCWLPVLRRWHALGATGSYHLTPTHGTSWLRLAAASVALSRACLAEA
jgi:hypothetical protein